MTADHSLSPLCFSGFMADGVCVCVCVCGCEAIVTRAGLTAQMGEIQHLRNFATGVSFAFFLFLCQAFVTLIPQPP